MESLTREQILQMIALLFRGAMGELQAAMEAGVAPAFGDGTFLKLLIELLPLLLELLSKFPF